MQNNTSTHSSRGSTENTFSNEDVGIPGLFPVCQWDIDDEMAHNDALREYRREQEKLEL